MSTETMTQEPTVAELEEAVTHLAGTARRYGRFDRRYPEWHQEINHLLDDRAEKIREDQVLTPVAPMV